MRVDTREWITRKNVPPIGELFTDGYKIIGFPFFNKDNRIDKFEKAIGNWIKKL